MKPFNTRRMKKNPIATRVNFGLLFWVLGCKILVRRIFFHVKLQSIIHPKFRESGCMNYPKITCIFAFYKITDVLHAIYGCVRPPTQVMQGISNDIRPI